MAIKKSDLYSSLWASCDELRGGMDASQYKDYVLFLLFIKYVSDKYANYDGFEPPVVIPPGASFNDMIAMKGKSNIGERINTEVIAPLVEKNDRLARSDFPDFDDPNKLGEGPAKVEKLTNLVAIFEGLDFARNRADHDDLLGDAYEYLMRHFATESGKSKGQFYTPAEVSRIMAKAIGISPANTVAATTAYDPTCGSGSLLLKVAAEAGKHITLEGQEKDVTTAGLARMNMILHDFSTANILSGNTLASPKFKDGERLRTYDYVVANPPFSDKTWSTGITLGPGGNHHERFEWGVPPKKQGDYAYLLHILRSMKSTAKGACILPHGVLFRGNAEAVIREKLVRSGYLKGIIGLPANLFYGTGIPACIIVLDKENAPTRKGVFMIDASRSFRKDGNKNRLREQDLHRIVDTFRRQVDVPGYARTVPVEEIADPRNNYNLNLPRYIDAAEPEDIQDIDGHLRGGIPQRDVEALSAYWTTMPALQEDLFKSAGRDGYLALALPATEVRTCVLEHPQFKAVAGEVATLFERWQTTHRPRLQAFKQDDLPKDLIHTVSEDLLATFRRFRGATLLDPYDVYQHLMDFWAEAMGDDCYLIAGEGWINAARPRQLVQVKNKEGKLVWPEDHDYVKGKRRFKSDLIPRVLMIARYFAPEQEAIDATEAEIASIEQKFEEQLEEHGDEEGLLSEVVEGEGEKRKITERAVNARLREVKGDPDFVDEQAALEAYKALVDRQKGIKACLKKARSELEEKLEATYAAIDEKEIKALVVDNKWLARLAAEVHGEVERTAQTLTGRVRQLAERYATPLPKLVEDVETISTRVERHLKQMGAVWI